MGYHIIIPDNTEYIRYYVEDLQELADIDDINEQTMIYEGVGKTKYWKTTGSMCLGLLKKKGEVGWLLLTRYPI